MTAPSSDHTQPTQPNGARAITLPDTDAEIAAIVADPTAYVQETIARRLRTPGCR